MIIGGWRGPGWQVFDADPRLSSQIRGWINAAVGGHRCPVDAADAALVVTELFSNAVLYGPAGGRVLVGYCLWRQGARLVVCDGGGTGRPRLVHGGELGEGGRGLRIVDSLAARWGSFRLPGAQAVWCDIGLPLRAATSDAWAWLNLVLSSCDLSASRCSVAPSVPDTLTVRCTMSARHSRTGTAHGWREVFPDDAPLITACGTTGDELSARLGSYPAGLITELDVRTGMDRLARTGKEGR